MTTDSTFLTDDMAGLWRRYGGIPGAYGRPVALMLAQAHDPGPERILEPRLDNVNPSETMHNKRCRLTDNVAHLPPPASRRDGAC